MSGAGDADPSMALVALHFEAVADDARTLRWPVAPGLFGFVGEVRSAPGELGALLTESVLESVTVELAAVCTRLAPRRDWKSDGPRVRTALQSALGASDRWVPADGAATGDDDLLRSAAEQVIAGRVGDYVRSHGGDITVLSAAGGRVELRMTGACGHCPASDFTLGNRVEVALRELYPQLEGVSAATDGASAARGLLRLLPSRRR